MAGIEIIYRRAVKTQDIADHANEWHRQQVAALGKQGI
jgi:hypothetical protein